MLPYTPIDQFPDAQIYDLSDDVLGGDAGDSNVPIKELFDRTEYLYKRQNRFADVKIVTGAYSFDDADVNKLLVFNITNNTSFDLPAASLYPAGFIIPVTTRINAIKALTVNGTIRFANESRINMHMHDGEVLWFVGANDHWEIANAFGNFSNAGQDIMSRKQLRNTLIRNGQIVNRQDVPRLAEFMLSLVDGQERVGDATWLSDPFGQPKYRGLYSTGNGTTTMRLPDDRGMYDRYLDLGRGIDTGRLHNYAGGYEPDDIKAHSHTQKVYTAINNGGRRPVGYRDTQDDLGDSGVSTGSTGIAENRVKSNAKLPLVFI